MEQLKSLYISFFGSAPQNMVPLTGSASNRKYFRLSSSGKSCVGVVGTDVKENEAFLTIAHHFRERNINVPEVLAVSDNRMCYLQEDLGDETLYDRIEASRVSGNYPDGEELCGLLCRTVALLPKMQFEGARGLDFSVCYPQSSFDRRMIMFDLNYFKYCFLKPSGVGFDEILLQQEMEGFADALLSCQSSGALAGARTFMHRDFQARNVMISEGAPYFIDFQGGRQGPVYYDVASFIWHARSGYQDSVKEAMLDAYLDALAEYVEVDREVFLQELQLFVLFRNLQVLGAYGFRGLVEQKSRFVTGIPAVLDGLTVQLTPELRKSFPHLCHILEALTRTSLAERSISDDGRLTVYVYSFSYKKGIPRDLSGNGGGYVFDCRSIHNPGRYQPYRNLTGKDEPVIRFLEEDGEILGFLEHVYGVVDPHVETFCRRGFTHLMVSFGCTGGQHRSVYCAEHLAAHLRERFPEVRVCLNHREQQGL